MSNKTSDKNVGNKIKQQTENTIKYYKNIDNIEEVPIDILRAMYKDILSDYTRQKQINEEHQKINGELRQSINTVEKEKADWIKAYQEEKDSQFELLKRIQELEEEIAMLKKASNIAKEVNIEDVTYVINKSCKEFMSNYIPKQAVIEALEDIKDYFDRLNGPDEDIEYIRQVKEELLEGGK